MSNILNNIAKGALDSTGSLLTTVGLKSSKSAIIRTLGAQVNAKVKPAESEMDINNGQEQFWNEVEKQKLVQAEFYDSAENVIKYYRNRWITDSSNQDPDDPYANKNTDNSMHQTGTAKKTEKSLYSKLATKRFNVNHIQPEEEPRDRRWARSRAEKSLISPGPDTTRYQKMLRNRRSGTKPITIPMDKDGFKSLRNSVSAPSFYDLDKFSSNYAPRNMEFGITIKKDQNTSDPSSDYCTNITAVSRASILGNLAETPAPSATHQLFELKSDESGFNFHLKSEPPATP